MSIKKHQAASPQSLMAAEKIAKATQKSGQTKEHTKLIAQGIQKGIEQYKKQQKVKARAADKAKKQQRKAQLENSNNPLNENTVVKGDAMYRSPMLPWTLLIISWIGFAIYFLPMYL